jgi:DNA polymerase elongation subunit (family B)
MEHVLEVVGDNGIEKDNLNETIDKFFRIIDLVKPDVITGYNSENFDWPSYLNVPIFRYGYYRICNHT